jgi:DNA-binding NarL/FixJ family response regulator
MDAHKPARSRLTGRQTQVLRELAQGKSMKGIARQLGISVKTVETHRQNIMQRLGIRHIPGLVRFALRNGILPMSWLKMND